MDSVDIIKLKDGRSIYDKALNKYLIVFIEWSLEIPPKHEYDESMTIVNP